MTTVGFIRHGMTDWNLEGRLQGHRDIPLNAFGRQQARQLALRLSEEKWDVIVSSDLSRAVETAQIIAEQCHIKDHLIEPRLRERDYGMFEGTTHEERVKKWGEQWRTLLSGMESDEALVQRALDCFHDLTERFEGKKILIVSHGGLLTRLLGRLFPDISFSPMPNTAYNLLVLRNGSWELEMFNSTAHLD